jgi:type II secretory pathway pseudopilin PulG
MDRVELIAISIGVVVIVIAIVVVVVFPALGGDYRKRSDASVGGPDG